ncbi:hypothetical protein [Paenarthrobacter sp. NPDC057981]|uniref:hypothetical protein n=1 Tax=Paenarthrobacter sp. NPDC057981 TaxID=3346297 RepID=UPI0036DDB5EF
METLVVVGAVLAVPVAVIMLVAWRMILRPVAKERLPAHSGSFQSQRGRVYRKGGTYRNASPSDGGSDADY